MTNVSHVLPVSRETSTPGSAIAVYYTRRPPEVQKVPRRYVLPHAAAVPRSDVSRETFADARSAHAMLVTIAVFHVKHRDSHAHTPVVSVKIDLMISTKDVTIHGNKSNPTGYPSIWLETAVIRRWDTLRRAEYAVYHE
jgi:hypothetical protein